MTLDTLRALADWLVPLLCGALGWLTSSALRAVRKKKEIEETYKKLYESIQGTLLELQEDNKKLYRAVGRLQRALHQVNNCAHYDLCPVRGELQKQSADSKGVAANRQRNARKTSRATDRGDPDERSEDGGDEEPT